MKIVECPRDAMQGIKDFIPTEKKIEYINALLKVGFDTIDVGSFVSARAIPQMADTAAVLNGLSFPPSCASQLLAIVANARGAEEAAQFDVIKYLGFPFSVSETFQLRNTNSTISQSLSTVGQIQELCQKNNKKLVVYLSMAFGNPYGDKWDVEIVSKWARELSKMGVSILALSDTIGSSEPGVIRYLFGNLIKEFPDVEFGAHLHTTPETAPEKIEAAWSSGCRRFDGAINGFGGCPMAKDELVGNMPTERLLEFFESRNLPTGINKKYFQEAVEKAAYTFPVLN